MTNKLLVCFAYAFPHKKTYEGLAALIAADLKPDLIIAAPWVKMPLTHPLIRTAPRGMQYPTAAEIAKACDISFVEAAHNSDLTLQVLRESECTLGLILGARILDQNLIEQFSLGIANAHSGILPQNRGLDCEKWAVHYGLPQASTLHLIDSKVDRGSIVNIEMVKVYEDDSFADIAERIQNASYKQIVSFLQHPVQPQPELVVNNDLASPAYHGRMDRNVERGVLAKFERYKLTYAELLADWVG